MAAGDIFNARLAVTGTAATLDALAATGAKTYTYISLRATAGNVAMGNASVTQANGFILKHGETLSISPVSGTAAGANINFIGPGTVDFFGITSA